MTSAKKIMLLACIAIILPLVGARSSFSEVKIELRNGRRIIADSCRKSGGSLVCDKMGGSFKIDEKEIVGMKTIEQAEEAGEGEGAPPEPVAEGAKKEGGHDDGRVSADSAVGEQTSPAARLEEIRGRKGELVRERERLVKERMKLQDDLKKAPDWMMPERYDELNKRNADLDARIKKFNEEVKKLNAEEDKIRSEMDQGSPAPPAEVTAPTQ